MTETALSNSLKPLDFFDFRLNGTLPSTPIGSPLIPYRSLLVHQRGLPDILVGRMDLLSMTGKSAAKYRLRKTANNKDIIAEILGLIDELSYMF